MRRPIFSTLWLTLALAVAAPAGLAASRIDVVDLDVQDLDGEPLTRLPLGESVVFRAQVRNLGPDNHTGAVRLAFHIRSDDGAYDVNQTRTVTLTLAVGASENVTFEWAPTQLGDHTAEVFPEGVRANNQTLAFTVAETAVKRGTLVDYLLEYAWFYGAFLGTVVLYAAVARIRKP